MAEYSSFTEAVSAAKAGQKEAFGWLYEKTGREKRFIAIKYMKNEIEADDVLQDAYLKAWQKLDTLADPEKFPGWLGQIVANTALEALRRKRPITFSDMSGENDEGEEFVYDIQDEDISRQPELAYTDKERSELIRGMIDGLSDDQRLCVMMFYIQGLSVKEIAESLGCSENTVKSRLNYGRKNIKASAEALEKKGYKFFGIAPVPLLYFLIRAEAMSQGVELVAPQLAPLGAASVQPMAQPQAAAQPQPAAAQPQPAAPQSQPTAAPVEQPVAPQPAGSAAASGGMTSSSVGGVASAGGALGKSFFATLGGKIVIGVAGLAVVGGLGFGGYQLLSRTQPDTVAEAPAASGQATDDNIDEPLADEPAATEAPTPEPTVEPYKPLYAKVIHNLDKQDAMYELVDVDEDETPELLVVESGSSDGVTEVAGGEKKDYRIYTIVQGNRVVKCGDYTGYGNESNYYPTYLPGKNWIHTATSSQDQGHHTVYHIGDSGKFETDDYYYMAGMTEDYTYDYEHVQELTKNDKKISLKKYKEEVGGKLDNWNGCGDAVELDGTKTYDEILKLLGEDSGQETTADQEETAGPEEVDYKSLYAAYLKKHSSKKTKYDLIYLDDDDVPELLAQKISSEASVGGEVFETHYDYFIYTIRNGKVKKLWKGYGSTNVRVGTPCYYERKGKITESGRAGWGTYYTMVYSIDKSGKVKEDHYEIITTDDNMMDAKPGTYKNGSKKPKKKYEKELEKITKNPKGLEAKKSYKKILSELQ